jgi:hypothetical protein
MQYKIQRRISSIVGIVNGWFSSTGTDQSSSTVAGNGQYSNTVANQSSGTVTVR